MVRSRRQELGSDRSLLRSRSASERLLTMVKLAKNIKRKTKKKGTNVRRTVKFQNSNALPGCLYQPRVCPCTVGSKLDWPSIRPSGAIIRLIVCGARNLRGGWRSAFKSFPQGSLRMQCSGLIYREPAASAAASVLPVGLRQRVI